MDYTSKFRPRLTVMIYFGIGLKCAFPPVNRVNRWNRTRGRGGGHLFRMSYATCIGEGLT